MSKEKPKNNTKDSTLKNADLEKKALDKAIDELDVDVCVCVCRKGDELFVTKRGTMYDCSKTMAEVLREFKRTIFTELDC